MKAVPLLMGLLVLSYLGSFLVAGRSARGAGLPSGVEYVALGFVLGPHVLDLVGAEMLDAFEPIVHVALGWMAFVVGLDFGSARGRPIRAGSFAFGLIGALVTGCAVAAAAWWALARLDAPLPLRSKVLLAGGLGCACSETTRHAVRWVVERHAARGPLSDRLAEIAHADDLVPLLALSVLFALEPTRHVAVHVPLRDWPAWTVGLGLVLGAAAALLLRGEVGLQGAWGVLFGLSLLATGTAARLDLSTLTACFFMGVATRALSRHRGELRAMVAPTERPVLLPTLLLAGARLDVHVTTWLPWVAAAALAARVAAKVALGGVLAVAARPARRAGAASGLALLSSGALAMSIGLAYALRFPGVVGDTVLAVAAVSATFGELVAPAALRRVLRLAGEVEDAGAPPAEHGRIAA